MKFLRKRREGQQAQGDDEDESEDVKKWTAGTGRGMVTVEQVNKAEKSIKAILLEGVE